MKADLHMHSAMSDGSNTGLELVDMAIMKRLDAIAITDHNTIEHLKQIPKNPKVEIITGIEISAIDSQTGIRADILGYGFENIELIEKLVLPFNQERGAGTDKKYIDVHLAVNGIKEAGGQAVLAHPGREKNFYLAGKVELDGIEYNHHANCGFDRRIIEKYASKYNLFLTGGSDFHGENDTVQVEIGDYLSPRFVNRNRPLLHCNSI